MVTNFRYLEAGRLALSGVPLSAEAAEWLHAQGIRSVISLEMPPAEVREAFKRLGMAWQDCCLSDFAAEAPDPDVLAGLIARAIEEEPAALVH